MYITVPYGITLELPATLDVDQLFNTDGMVNASQITERITPLCYLPFLSSSISSSNLIKDVDGQKFAHAPLHKL